MSWHASSAAVVAALVLVACGSTAPSPRSEVAGRTTSSPAAFVVFDGMTTAVLPVAPDRDAVAGDGLWLVDPEDLGAVLHRAVPSVAAEVGLRSCPCTSIANACIGGPVLRRIRPAEAFAVTLRERCSCWAAEGEAAAPELPEYVGDRERIAPCEPLPQPPLELASFVGGTLYAVDSTSTITDECGRETEHNVHDVFAPTVRVYESDAIDVRGSWQACALGHLGPDQIFGSGGALANPECSPNDAERDIDALESGELDGNAFDSCAHCEVLTADAHYLTILNGRICSVDLETVPYGAEHSSVTCEPLRPDRCPSPLDPCGDPEPFGDVLDPDVGFWVSTDGHYALNGASVFVPGRAESVVDHELSPGAIGVLFVDDASALIAAMEHEYPTEDTEVDFEACESDDDCREGLCQQGACAPACERDADCDWLGMCEASCTSGHCGPPAIGCSEELPCEDEFHCVAGNTCVACLHDGHCDGEICQAGACRSAECQQTSDCAVGICAEHRCVRDCSGTQSAREHGSLCATRLRAEEWDAAETACLCGLALQPQPRIEGALRYNLGRIAEGRERPDEARRHYARSLVLRPGNAIVRRRLDALAE